MNLSVREIAEACRGKLVLQGKIEDDTCVSSLVIDSRKVENGGICSCAGRTGGWAQIRQSGI